MNKNTPKPQPPQPAFDWPAPGEGWPNSPRIGWTDYLALWIAEIRADRSPAAQFLADHIEDARYDALMCGLTNPEDHTRWNAETAEEARDWLEGAWDPTDTWEADDQTGALDGHDCHAHAAPDDTDDADLN